MGRHPTAPPVPLVPRAGSVIPITMAAAPQAAELALKQNGHTGAHHPLELKIQSHLPRKQMALEVLGLTPHRRCAHLSPTAASRSSSLSPTTGSPTHSTPPPSDKTRDLKPEWWRAMASCTLTVQTATHALALTHRSERLRA